MKKQFIKVVLLLIIIIFNLIFSTSVMAQTRLDDPLPSWNEGTNKQAIINFVESITNPQSNQYISPDLRIATFDNDGTLWAEKPTYFQAAFTLSRLLQLAPQHPEWQNKQPFQAVLESDQQYLANLSVSELLEMVMVTHAGMNQQEFENNAKDFFLTAKHPRFQKLYQEVIYQPMLELLQYLQANDFTNYICSAGGLDFMRLVSEEIYGIPPENVIGSSIVKEFKITPSGFEFVRQPKLVEPINDRGGKPFDIDRFIGKKPAKISKSMSAGTAIVG